MPHFVESFRNVEKDGGRAVAVTDALVNDVGCAQKLVKRAMLTAEAVLFVG